MKTLTNKSTLVIALAVLLSTYIFASASLINISVNPDPMTTVLYVNVPGNNDASFNLEEEEYIDDIPCAIIDTCIDNEYEKAVSVEFTMEEEAYIDDIPKEIYNKL